MFDLHGPEAGPWGEACAYWQGAAVGTQADRLSEQADMRRLSWRFVLRPAWQRYGVPATYTEPPPSWLLQG